MIASAACATPSGTGTAMGAVGGGVIGGAVGGTGGALFGAALGGMLGYGAGRAVEHEDARRAQMAFEANQRQRWQNQQTGQVYEVIPTNTIILSGRECREFTMLHTANDGRSQRVRGIACRQPDGNWTIES